MGIEITAKATGKESGEILVYGDIRDTKWWEDDVTPSDFDKKLKELGDVKDLTVRINSYGGSVFAGQAIVAMLDRKRESGCKVRTIVDGIAASMASVIAQAGDPVIMSEGAMMMIHKPSGIQWGNADDFRKYAEKLDKAEGTLISVYMRRYNGTEDDLKDMLREETWLTAQEAVQCGLCMEIEGTASVAAYANGFTFHGLQVPAAYFGDAKNKIKFTNSGGEKKMFDEATQSKIEDVLKSGKQAVISKAGNSYIVTEMLDTAASSGGKEPEFLTAKQVEDAVGKAVDSEAALNALKALTAAGIDLSAAEAGLAKYK